MTDDFPDDDLPITTEWLDGLVLKPVKAITREFAMDKPIYTPKPYLEGGVLWLEIKGDTYQYVDLPLPHITTRGQLHVLLLLLGFAEDEA